MTFHGCHAGDDEPPVPGVVLDERLTDAGAGEVWGGRVEASGEPCTVRRLRLPSDPLVQDHVAQVGRALAAFDHPHVAAVLDVRATRDGIAVVSAPVPRPVSLATVLRARGRVESGEVVTIGTPLAQALAALHEAGLTHGRLCPQDVLFEPDGRPVLAGVGVAGLLGSAGRPADDVRELAAMLLDVMSGSVGPEAAAVAVTVSPALVDEPTRRPTAAE
ncbi:MAG TPA: protein kinase, partial [Frankiaceae bacterium]|nr:protein kinase [Frankiaceae bacterium]